MRRLERKYVFHIPLYEFRDDGLALIDIDEILEDLIFELNEAGFDSLYVSQVRGYYRSRSFDEKLITLFCDSNLPEEIFRKWFVKNNDILGQEAFAFECNNEMFIEMLD